MNRLNRLIFDNPLVLKEFRTRMRGTRAYWILFSYLGVLTLGMMLTYYSFISLNHRYPTLMNSPTAPAGEAIFYFLTVAQAFLVIFITPAITSGAITLEKEQRTYEMMLLTRIPRFDIVFSKMSAAFAFVCLLIFSSLPLFSICFLFGGVSPGKLIHTYELLLTGSLFGSSLGLMWSSISKSTTISVMLSYATLFIPVILLFFALSYISFLENVSNSSSFMVSLLGFKLSLYGVLNIVLIFLSVILCSVSLTHIQAFPQRMGWLPRGLTLLFMYFVSAASCFLVLSSNSFSKSQGPVLLMTIPTQMCYLLPCIMIPALVIIFATGEFTAWELANIIKRMLWGFTPKGITKGVLASRIPFLLLISIVVVAGINTGFAMEIRHGIRNAGYPAMQPMHQPTSTSSGTTNMKSFPHEYLNTYKGSYATSLKQMELQTLNLLAFFCSYVFGFGMFCILISTLVQNRWVAMALSAVSLAIVVILPLNSQLNPDLRLFLTMFDPVNPLILLSRSFYMGLPVKIFYRDSTLSLLVAGALSFFLLFLYSIFERRNNGANSVSIRPYDEMVAEL